MENISFIIPVFNAEKTLGESVHSVYDGNFREGDETILIDDASTDRSLEIAESLQKKFPGIKILRHFINKGSAAAGRNTGIDQSKNELLFTLDADNLLLPGSVRKLSEYLSATKSDCVAFGEIHVFGNDTRK